jgi:hypothetical protein
LRDAQFIRGEIFTRWLDERLADFLALQNSPAVDSVLENAAIIAALLHQLNVDSAAAVNSAEPGVESRWKREARFEGVNRSL